MNSITGALTDSSGDRQKELLAYFQNLEQNPEGYKLAINELTNNRSNLNDSAVFFYFKIIECHIKTRFELDSEENRFLVKQYVCNYFVAKKYDYQSFLLNKYASIVNSLFQVEYPLRKWPTFFSDFLAQCNDKHSCSLFLRILDQINVEIGEREHILTVKEMEKSGLIKDLMRESDVNRIVQFWFSLIDTYNDSDPEMVSYCLSIMGKYVSWIDINLITSDARMTNILNLLYNGRIRNGVLDCIFGILHKGMDPIAKATFIEQFCQLQCISDLFTKEYDKSERLFGIRLAKFFNKIGVELTECFRKLKASKTADENDVQHKLTPLFAAIDSKFLTLCKFLSSDDLETSVEVHPFAREYIQLLKSLSKPTGARQFTVADAKIQEVILVVTKILIKKCKYPPDYEFPVDLPDADEDDSEFEKYRRSCNTLLENLNALNRDLFAQFVCSTVIEPTLKNENLKELEFNELEIALYLLKCIGDYLEANRESTLSELLGGLIRHAIIEYPHIAITVMYFEIVCKYEKQIASSELNELMPQVLISFLDKNGLKSPSIRLRSRVTSLFNRFVKSNLKNKNSNKKILTFSEEIVNTVEPLIKLDYYLSFKGKLFNEFNANEQEADANRDNHLLLYESVAYLIIQNSLLDDKQKTVLFKQLLLDAILANANESSGALQSVLLATTDKADPAAFEKRITVLCEDIAHLVNLTVFSLKPVASPELMKTNGVQGVYLELFDHFAKLLSLNDLHEDALNVLQQSLCHLLHRLIVCLDESDILPLLPLLIRSVFLPKSYFTVATIQEIVPLIAQFVTKFKHSWMFHQHLLPFLNEFFLPFVSYIFNLTNSGGLEEEEKANLQKTYFNFISIITNNVPEVLRNLETQVFEQILITLVQGLEMNDLPMQRSLISTFKRMIESHEQLSKTTNLSNGSSMINEQTNVLNVQLFKCIYGSAIPTLITFLLKMNDQNQLINEVLGFLIAVQEVRGCTEFGEFLAQCFAQNFSIYDGEKIKQLSDAFAVKNLKLLKSSFKELKQLYQQVKPAAGLGNYSLI